MKRFLKGFSVVGLGALMLALGACDLTELNENPNEPTTVTTESLLANAQNDLATIYWDDYAGAFWVRYAQYWTTNQYTDSDRWAFPTRRAGANDANWEDFYLVLNDLQEVIRKSRETPGDVEGFGPPENQIAIAKIMQAFTFHMMTDMWGPIPYAEALKGRTQGNFNPSYTSQEQIYQGLIDSLTTASQMIDASQPTLEGGDVVYGGDMSKWKKLANSLKMRVAIRMADVAPTKASTAISEAISAGVFESNADNAAIPFSSSPPYQNPFFENYEVAGRDDWAATATMLDVMNPTEDPRRDSYFADANPNEPGAQYNGFPYGLPGGEAQALFTSADNFFSRPSERVRGDASAPAFIMFYDEVLFTKAEAAQRNMTQPNFSVGNISGNPESLYRDAIEASLRRWGVTDQSEIDSYIDAVPYDNSNSWAPEGPPGATWEHTLGIQKWIALYMQGIQGWAEWRRLDFQELLAIPPGNPGQEMFNCDFPLRMSYPTAETTLNPEARQTAVDEYLGGTDHQGLPGLWWDVDTPGCN